LTLDWKNKDVRFFLFAACLGLATALVFSAISFSWARRTPPGWVYSGFLQSDQHQYTAIAREVFERGSGLTYVIPYSLDDDPAPVYFHWTFIALAWLQRLTGLPYPVCWELWRALWSTAFFLSFALLLDRILPSGKMRTLVFILVMYGGGIAAALAGANRLLLPLAGGQGSEFLDAFAATEGAYHWWFLNLFRNVLYPLEATYHCLFFLTLWAAISQRGKTFLVAFAATAACGVFTTANLAVILGPWFAIECLIVWRRRSDLAALPGPFLKQSMVAFILVIAVFLIYYAVVVPAYGEEGAAMLRQHTQYPMPLIPLRGYLKAYFWPLAGTLLALASPAVRRWLAGEPRGRLLIVWIVGTILLANNHWVLRPDGIQPPHFTRGYLYAALALCAAVGLQLQQEKWRSWLRLANKRTAVLVALAAIVLLTSDNLAFVAEIAARTPHPRVLTFEQQTREALEAIEAQGTPGKRLNVLNLGDDKIGILIPVYTRHNPFLADVIPTPDYYGRQADLEAWIRGGGQTPLLEKYAIDLIVIPRRLYSNPTIQRAIRGKADQVWQNGLWVLLRIPSINPS